MNVATNPTDVADSPGSVGGGDFSTSYATPSYQQGVWGTHLYNAVEFLIPTDCVNVGITVPTEWNFNATPSVTHDVGSGRALPHLSIDADPYSGYLEY